MGTAVSSSPVLVLGAGPVGLTAAALLRRWGIEVLVFDARSERDAVGSKAICQARDVLDIWESVGVGQVLAAGGVTWTTARTFCGEQEIATWEFEDRGRSVFPPFVNVSQERTESELEAALEDLGCTVRWGHALVTLDNHEDGVVATFDTPDGPLVVTGSYAVIATGARSDRLRSELGLSFDGETFEDQFLICDIEAEMPGWEKERRFYFDPPWNPGRQVLIHACPGSTYRIDWQVPAGYDLVEDEANGGLDARIRHIIGDRPYTIRWKSVYRFHSRHTDRMVVGRTLLAGDVAHLVSPFGARGLNTGVFDADNAAWKLAFLLRGWAGPGLLASYDEERMAATRENIEVTGSTMRFLVPQDSRALAERRAVLEAAAASPRAVDIDSGRFAEPFWYVDSPLTTTDESRTFEGRPAKGRTPRPAPGVLVPDHAIEVGDRPGATRLREVLRDGLTVLLAEGGRTAEVEQAARKAVAAPVRVLALDAAVGGPDIAQMLGVKPGEAWLVRPDAYVAAVVADSDASALTAAMRRAVGY